MKKNKSDQLANRLYLIAAIAILVGAFFKLQHYPYGSTLTFGGFLLGTVASYLYIRGLKRTIKTLEEKEPKG